MSDHPSTYKADWTQTDEIEWGDGASIHRRDHGQGVFHAMKALYRGTLAEMVTMIRNMPEAQRNDFVILKSGDRVLEAGEILTLAQRRDFPG